VKILVMPSFCAMTPDRIGLASLPRLKSA